MNNWTIGDKTLTDVCDNTSLFLNCFFPACNLSGCNNCVLLEKNNLLLPKMLNEISIVSISIIDITFFIGYYKHEEINKTNELIRATIDDMIERNCFRKNNYLEELKNLFEKIITNNCLFVLYPYCDNYFDNLDFANYIAKKTAAIRVLINLKSNISLFVDKTKNQVNFYYIKI